LERHVYLQRVSVDEAHGLYNRKSDVFYHFGSAFNNMKFRLFCPFLTIPLPTNKNFYFLDFSDRPLAYGLMVTLLYTLRNFNSERDNNTCMILEVTLGTLIHCFFYLYKFMKSHQLSYPSRLAHVCVYA